MAKFLRIQPSRTIQPSDQSKHQTHPAPTTQSTRRDSISLACWRQLESLPDDATLYPVPHLDLLSPYPVQLTPDEYRLAYSLRKLFPPAQLFVDSYFTRPGANTSQIDCLALNESGIFVFESKGYAGWIFGNSKRQQWTQILAYGAERHTFYNPVYQNQNHIKNLEHALGPNLQFFSIIVFSDQATLKSITELPANCYVCQQHQVASLVQHISTRETTLTPAQMDAINRKIRRARVPITPDLRQRHNNRINK